MRPRSLFVPPKELPIFLPKNRIVGWIENSLYLDRCSRDERTSTKLHRKTRRTAGRARSHAARCVECGPAASKMRPKRAAGGEKFGKHQRTFGSLVTP